MKSNKKKIIRYINVAKGQLDGVSRMIETDEYCVDISNQILAAIAILKKANDQIITDHISHCVKNATDEQLEKKMEEIAYLLKRMH